MTLRAAPLVLALVLGGALVPASGTGLAEGAQDRVVRTWDWDEGSELELRGQIEFAVVPGPRLRVTVEASRALFDQLSVVHWWGKTWVVVESGLRGPREPGRVVVTVEVPRLTRLAVANSRGSVEWAPGGSLAAWEGSAVTVHGFDASLNLEASWGSSVVLEGAFASVAARVSSQAWVDAREARVTEARVDLDQGVYLAGATDRGMARVRGGGRLQTDLPAPWSITEE